MRTEMWSTTACHQVDHLLFPYFCSDSGRVRKNTLTSKSSQSLCDCVFVDFLFVGETALESAARPGTRFTILQLFVAVLFITLFCTGGFAGVCDDTCATRRRYISSGTSLFFPPFRLSPFLSYFLSIYQSQRESAFFWNHTWMIF